MPRNRTKTIQPPINERERVVADARTIDRNAVIKSIRESMDELKTSRDLLAGYIDSTTTLRDSISALRSSPDEDDYGDVKTRLQDVINGANSSNEDKALARAVRDLTNIVILQNTHLQALTMLSLDHVRRSRDVSNRTLELARYLRLDISDAL